MRGLPGRLTATVQPAKAKDNRGTATGSVPGSYTVRRCSLAPLDSTVDHERETTVATTAKLYAPSSAAFPEHATVTVAGFVGTVEGRPDAWGRDGQVVLLRKVTG